MKTNSNKPSMTVITYKDFYIVDNRKIDKVDLVNQHTGKIRVVKTVQAAKKKMAYHACSESCYKVQRLYEYAI